MSRSRPRAASIFTLPSSSCKIVARKRWISAWWGDDFRSRTAHQYSYLDGTGGACSVAAHASAVDHREVNARVLERKVDVAVLRHVHRVVSARPRVPHRHLPPPCSVCVRVVRERRHHRHWIIAFLGPPLPPKLLKVKISKVELLASTRRRTRAHLVGLGVRLARPDAAHAGLERLSVSLPAVWRQLQLLGHRQALGGLAAAAAAAPEPGGAHLRRLEPWWPPHCSPRPLPVAGAEKGEEGIAGLQQHEQEHEEQPSCTLVGATVRHAARSLPPPASHCRRERKTCGGGAIDSGFKWQRSACAVCGRSIVDCGVRILTRCHGNGGRCSSELAGRQQAGSNVSNASRVEAGVPADGRRFRGWEANDAPSFPLRLCLASQSIVPDIPAWTAWLRVGCVSPSLGYASTRRVVIGGGQRAPLLPRPAFAREVRPAMYGVVSQIDSGSPRPKQDRPIPTPIHTSHAHRACCCRGGGGSVEPATEPWYVCRVDDGGYIRAVPLSRLTQQAQAAIGMLV